MSMIQPPFISDPFASSNGGMKPVFTPGPEGHNNKPKKWRIDLTQLPQGVTWGSYTHSIYFIILVETYKAPHFLSTFFLFQMITELIALIWLYVLYFIISYGLVSGLVVLIGFNLTALSFASSGYCKIMIDYHQKNKKLMNLKILGLTRIFTLLSSGWMGLFFVFLSFYTLYYGIIAGDAKDWYNQSKEWSRIWYIIFGLLFLLFAGLFISRTLFYQEIQKAAEEFNSYLKGKIPSNLNDQGTPSRQNPYEQPSQQLKAKNSANLKKE